VRLSVAPHLSRPLHGGEVGVLDFEEEVADRDVEVVAEHDDGVNAEVALAVLNVRDVLLGEAGVFADLLLGDAFGAAQLDDGLAYALADFLWVGGHGGIYYFTIYYLPFGFACRQGIYDFFEHGLRGCYGFSGAQAKTI